ncbi:adenylosuccinate lyase [Candidatus Woesearchaeota archaeon]|nr:adenylosuccinate lyase [Candidatus Woesearchaeota archaeon]
MDIFENISPFDYRYYLRNNTVKKDISNYLSEKALIKFMLEVELTLVKALHQEGLCPKSAVTETSEAINKVKAEDVYLEEDRIKHNVRALVNCIRKHVSDKTMPYIHFAATSHDIICTAESLRYKLFTENVLIPKLKEFASTLIKLALREKKTVQIGRTHGQHAVPITFGFSLSEYISRFSKTIISIEESAKNLRGKMAGAVGAYNAQSLFVQNPVMFEKNMMEMLDLKPSDHSTQIIEPEYIQDYVYNVIKSFGILANLSDDMRQLQRSEIGEVAEVFGSAQVGSSTMPHKRNPIQFENVKSMWKQIMPRMTTLFLDQISEHQRDLTNSASSRFIPEIIAGYYISVTKLNGVLSRLVIDNENMIRNFEDGADRIIAEPLYIMLASQSHPDAHEYVRKLTLKSQKENRCLHELLMADESLKPYINKLSGEQLEILKDPKRYIGLSVKKTETICDHWIRELKLEV